MTAGPTNQLYGTNRMSDSGIDAAAVREMQRLQVEVPMVCLICREEVKMIAAETAAAVCQCSRRKIYRWIEDGGLHFVEMRDGEVLVCGRSLSKKMDELDSTADKLSQRQAWAGR